MVPSGPGTTFPRRHCAGAGVGLAEGRGLRARESVREARMAGQVKDREAFQRLSFLYQVSPSRGRSDGASGAAGPG